jgi:hypothetical protein
MERNMFKIIAAAALTLYASASAFAAAPTLIAGQYIGRTIITEVIDPAGLCASDLGLVTGNIPESVATVTALGAVWTSTTTGYPVSGQPSGLYWGWSNAQFPALPAATSFTAQLVGTLTEYVDLPAGTLTTTVNSSTGTQAVLTDENGTDATGVVQSYTITILPTNVPGKDSGFRVTTVNTEVSVSGNVICFVSMDSIYLNTKK